VVALLAVWLGSRCACVNFDALIDACRDGGGLCARDSGQTNFDAGSDAGLDVGADAGLDVGADAGFDAGTDAGFDAGVDAGDPTFLGEWDFYGPMSFASMTINVGFSAAIVRGPANAYDLYALGSDGGVTSCMLRFLRDFAQPSPTLNAKPAQMTYCTVPADTPIIIGNPPPFTGTVFGIVIDAGTLTITDAGTLWVRGDGRGAAGGPYYDMTFSYFGTPRLP
jgi:hypothetical protein